MPDSGQPFTLTDAPLRLTTHGRRVPAWKEDHLGLVGPLQASPVRTEEPLEELTLVPMGAARLRLTCFPVAGSGDGAHDWVAPREPLPAAASHCWQGDTLAALSDGLLPESSGDHALPRFTFWPRRGSAEWVEYHFEQPRWIAAVEVYWFDDSGIGACRTPASWRLKYRTEGGSWRDVSSEAEPGVALDTFNRLTFVPVRATGLRLEVELRQDFSAGILEWRFE